MSKTFQFNAMFRRTGALVTILMGSLFLLVTVLLGVRLAQQESVPLMVIPILTVSMVFFIAFGWYFYSRHRGHININEDSIILQRGAKRIQLYFKEISEVKEFDRNMPPGITMVDAEGQTLKFSRMVENFDELYEILYQNIESMQLKLKNKMHFSARRFHSLNLYGSIGFFYLLFFIIGVFIWVGKTPKNPVESVLMLFGSATILSLLVLPIAYPTKKRPVEMRIHDKELELISFSKRSAKLLKADVEELQLKTENIGSRGAKRLAYYIHLKTKDGIVFKLDEQTCKGFKVGVEKLWRLFKQWYAA